MDNKITIGVMQPYFFPYLGYFQLINSVDIYVNLEHVNFMKRSYMVRNSLKNDIIINIPVSNGSQNKICTEVYVLADESWFKTFEKKIEALYKKELNYKKILSEIIYPWKNEILSLKRDVTISEFNFSSIQYICKYLEISTEFKSSVGITNRKKNEGIQDITKHFNGTHYINAIGGQKLYSKDDFLIQGINLNFIKMGEVNFDNPYISILDLLFRYPKDEIKKEIKNYTLI
jgi:hypothetical protein